MSSLFPMFVKLEGRSCLVVGAGTVGEPKIASLLACGARVRVVAPRASEQVKTRHREKTIAWERRAFEPSDLDSVFLVIAATNSRETNQLIFREAQRRQILCNVVDDPPHCDFFYPAIVQRGQLQIAISTAGLSPALAQRLRRDLEAQFGQEYADWLQELGRYRQELLARDLAAHERRALLHLSASKESFAARHDSGSAK
jgi:precorrin-2 dehydrogenase/sirohydrochlorin ferrochelatase